MRTLFRGYMAGVTLTVVMIVLLGIAALAGNDSALQFAMIISALIAGVLAIATIAGGLRRDRAQERGRHRWQP